MMKSEFIERVGFEPTAAEYAEIEAEYMGTEIDKDQFCKEWKKSGGIQRLMRLRVRRIEELEAELAKEKADFERMDSQYCKMINEINQLRKNDKDKLEQETARANEAERKLAEVFAIITGKEEA